MGVLAEKSLDFGVRIIKFSKFLNEKKEFVISKQILRSGTSIGANISEAKHAESKLDYIHKLSIAQKECSETLYWLDLMLRSEILTDNEYQSLHSDCDELLRIITSSLKTLKNNLSKGSS